MSGITRFYNRKLIKELALGGHDNSSIAKYVGCNVDTVRCWVSRGDVADMPRSGRPVAFGSDIQAKLTGFYCQTRPFAGNGQWTMRLAATWLNNEPSILGVSISKSTIQRILRANNLRPHLYKYFLHITDPCFFPKMAHLISLYNNPPENLYCFDECPGIQVLQRLAPDLRTEKMKLYLREFEYCRYGTVDVLAFLNVGTGGVSAQCRSDHKKETLVEVFEGHFKSAPTNDKLNYIMDNLNSHCCYELCQLVAKYSNVECPPEKQLGSMVARRGWLMKSDKRIIFHYTPYHGSWLNQVEYWFGMLNAKCLRETYNSPKDLFRSITKFQEFYNKLLTKPFKWKYTGEGLQEKAVSRFLGMLCNTTKIESGFLVKQIKLHINIANEHWGLVEGEIWLSLYEKFMEQRFLIEYVITMSAKKKFEEDLKYIQILIEILKHKLNIPNIQAA